MIGRAEDRGKRLAAPTNSEEFAWLLWINPQAALEGLPSIESSSGLRLAELHVRHASAWFALLCPAEARHHAETALALGILHHPEAHASCLGVLALAAKGVRDSAAERWRREQLAVIWKSGLVHSDVHVRALINGLSFVESANEASDAYNYALRVWSSTPYENHRLRTSRRLLLEYTYISWESLADIKAWITSLLALMDRASEAGEKIIQALGHLSLSQIYRKADLYSFGLLHASISANLWTEHGQPMRVAESLLVVARIYQSLGLVLQAEQVLSDLHGLGIGSRGRYIESERLNILADLTNFVGDAASSMRHAREAARVAPDATFVDIVPGLSALSFAAHAYMLRDREAIVEAVEMLKTAADRLDPQDPLAGLLRYACAALADDDVAAAEIAGMLRMRWPNYRSPTGFGIDDIISTIDLGRLLSAPSTIRTDLEEYWKHIVHLSGEDDERIRAQYRIGNCLPVLHRILAAGYPELTPELQFELGELVRFGAVSGLISSLGMPGENRGELRRLARENLLSRDIRYPAVYGEPRPVSIERRPTPLAEISGRSPIEVGSLLDLTSADVLQLYLRGHTLHWFYREPELPASHGVVVLPEQTVRLLNSASSLLTPRIGPFEARIAAELGLGEIHLRAVAAARTAAGPMVEMPELAGDLLHYLGKPERRRVWAAVRELPAPTVTELAAALGELIPERVFVRPASSVLFVSTDLALATLPLMLATRDLGPLVAHRLPVVMPPINLLAATSAGRPAGDVTAWTTTRIGNALGDLAFAGPRSREDEIVNALVIPDAQTAARRAVVYRGHLAEPPPGRPSEAGLFVGPGRVLSTRSLLEDAQPWRAPARLALLACRAAGWDLGGEWGGIAAAAMLRGSRDVIAPLWPLIDAEPAARLDDMIIGLIGTPGLLSAVMQERLAAAHDNWFSRAAREFPPHWWASLVLTSR